MLRHGPVADGGGAPQELHLHLENLQAMFLPKRRRLLFRPTKRPGEGDATKHFSVNKKGFSVKRGEAIQ